MGRSLAQQATREANAAAARNSTMRAARVTGPAPRRPPSALSSSRAREICTRYRANEPCPSLTMNGRTRTDLTPNRSKSPAYPALPNWYIQVPGARTGAA